MEQCGEKDKMECQTVSPKMMEKVMDILADPAMDAYVKTIPAATLSVSSNPGGQQAFLDFLASDEAKNIWEKHGYVVLN